MVQPRRQGEGDGSPRRNPGLPLRWTNFSLRANFAFDKTPHFAFRASVSRARVARTGHDNEG